jgi:hypothetical protein
MKNPTPRRVIPTRKWATLAATGVAVGLTGAAPAQAGPVNMPTLAEQPGHLIPAQADGGEGGEGGEGGAVIGVSPDQAYLTRLHLVEGHMKAAVLLYDKGLTDEAVGLAGHPEAEMMEDVRASLAERNATDFSDLLESVGTVMAEAGTPAAVDTAMANLSAAIEANRQIATLPPKTRLDSIVALSRAAAVEYAGSLENGTVADVLPWHEAYGFIEVAREQAAALLSDPDPLVVTTASRILDALKSADAAFGDIATTTQAQDPAILLALASRVELIAFAVN